MNILLDTHIAIWALCDDPALSERARKMILDPANMIYYSVISLWEVVLKHERRPVEIPLDGRSFSDYCRAAGYHSLQLTQAHVRTLDSLKRARNARKHTDPFDRLLLAQAKSESFSFLTHDRLISGYQEKNVMLV